mmetsp:Transcript_121381/g.388067  ORF Transcript_121381/g.388067 Transcript_121381/m.388067 type:complete len:129 (+) Transcript_121381:640-1026(+)
MVEKNAAADAAAMATNGIYESEGGDREGRRVLAGHHSNEVGEVMLSLGHDPTEAELHDMLDGVIEWFVCAMPDCLSEEQLSECVVAFHHFDTDYDGTITVEAVVTVMLSLGQHPTEAKLHDVFKGVVE